MSEPSPASTGAFSALMSRPYILLILCNLFWGGNVVAGKAAVEAWCPLQDQFQAMYIFDALVYNPGRVADDILFARSDGTLILTGHALAFGTRTGVPPYLKKANLTLSAVWREKLAGLQTDQARATLREVLGDKRLKALLTRAEQLAD